MYENHLILTFAFSWKIPIGIMSIDRRNEHSSCRTWFEWERWCSKIPFYPLHFFKTLRKSSNCVSSVTQREHRHQRTLFLRYLRCSWPSFHRTTRVILGWNGPISETKRMAEQAQVRGNYIREPCTTLSCWSSGTELAGVECGCLSLWWQRWLECLTPSTDCRHSPSRTRKMGRERDRTRIRTDVYQLYGS